MNKRQLLYMVLSFVTTIVLVLIAAVVILLLEKPQVKIVWTKGTEAPVESKAAPKGKWEGMEKRAIKMVKALQVTDPEAFARKKKKQKKEDVEKISVEKLAQSGLFEEKFKLAGLGEGEWEARYLKGAFYFVSFQYTERLISLGPTWLVDVQNKRVLPKNIMARAAMDPEAPGVQKFFERERQVIGAIANHSFESGVKLGGIMLIHFSKLKTPTVADEKQGEDGEEVGNRIIGWTVVHDYGKTYRAYFQWIESGEPTYADFEFDHAKKALRARNLQAANFMNLGSGFQDTERARIMPSTYNPEASRGKDLWTGPSRDRCRDKNFRRQCDAMAKVLGDRSQMEAVEWLLTVEAKGKDAFDLCKKDLRCKWSASTSDDNLYQISYIYNLSETEGEQKVSWGVDLKKNAIIPKDRISEMAFFTVHPRPRSATAP